MAGNSETSRFGSLVERIIDYAFSRWHHHKVVDRATFDAYQVMMVPDEGLIEFIARMLINTSHPVNDANMFQVGQVSVHRALCKFGAQLEELGHTCWSIVLHQNLDELSSTGGVHQTMFTQPSSHLTVQEFC
jgi:hypothetical protein